MFHNTYFLVFLIVIIFHYELLLYSSMPKGGTWLMEEALGNFLNFGDSWEQLFHKLVFFYLFWWW